MDDETKEDVRPMQSKTLPIRNFEDVDSWETLMFLYNAALKEIGTAAAAQAGADAGGVPFLAAGAVIPKGSMFLHLEEQKTPLL